MATFQLGRILIVLVIVAITGFYSLFRKQEIDTFFVSKGTELSSHSLLKSIPDVKVHDVVSDSDISLQQFISAENSAILVHIWGTWCAPCESEIPSFLDFVNKFDLVKLRVILIAVNDDKQKVKAFLQRFNNAKNIYNTLDVEGHVMDRFGTFKVPETFLFRPDGSLLKKFTGPQDWAQIDLNNQVSNLFQR